MILAELGKLFSNIKRSDFEQVVAHFFEKDRVWVLTHTDIPLPDSLKDALINALQKLTNGTPLAYIVGYRRFYDVDFQVSSAVLIPRQETEELIAMVEKRLLTYSNSITVADIGTGSGCIGLTLARLVPNHQYCLLDTSKDALAVAATNAVRLLPSAKNISLLQGDLLLPCQNILPQVLLANLPYLSDAVLTESPAMVTDFEPHIALYGGPDGLDLYRRLLDQIAYLYQKEPWPEMWWEISPEQKVLISATQLKLDKYKYDFIADLSGRTRFVHFYH